MQMLLVLDQALSSKGVWTQHTIVLDLSLNLGSIVFIIMEELGGISFQRGSFYFWLYIVSPLGEKSYTEVAPRSIKSNVYIGMRPKHQ